MSRTRMMLEHEAYELLRRYGVPVPPYEVVTGADEAARAARAVGFPVVMKIVSPDVVHKSDVGGVVVGVGDEQEARAAYERIVRGVGRRVVGARIEGVIVEKQMPRGVELLVGGKIDPTFGKVLSFGMGGTLVELLRDVSLRVLPVSGEDIERMLKEVRGYRLLTGWRGEDPRDISTLKSIIESLSRLFADRSDLVEFDINPLFLYHEGACAVDARLIVSDDSSSSARLSVPGESLRNGRELRAVLARVPLSIAVVGASSHRGKVGYSVLRNLRHFPGKVYAVNPHESEILGVGTYPSLSAIEGDVDVAVIAVPADAVPGVMDDAARKGVRLAVVISAGFREVGGEGARLEREVVRKARESGIRLIGPNCLGIMLPHLGLNATFDPIMPKPGPIAFISQSGAVITTTVDWSVLEEQGFSAVISVGNQADLGFVDFLEFALEDEWTKSVIMYVEEIKNGRQFLDVSRRVSRTKPIVAVKSGASARGRAAASSHTGSLAGSYDVYMAAFKQAGVIVSSSLEEAFGAAALLASEGYPRGRRAVVVSNAGGFAVLASDYAERYGVDLIELPSDFVDEVSRRLGVEWNRENPMDLLGDATSNRYATVFELLSRRADLWDIAFVVSVPTTVLDPLELATEIVEFSRGCPRVIVGCMLGGVSVRAGVAVLRRNHIPNFAELEDAFKVVGKALEVAPPVET